MKFLVALGNPGEEYNRTRHNAGRIVLEELQKEIDATQFEKDKRLQALISKGKIGEQEVTFIEPETFMNNSGRSVKPLIDTLEKLNDLVVIYDDVDLPLGKVRISFNRSSGGHNGVQSIIDHLKTEEFIRIRIGICPIDENGVMKKPLSDELVDKFILGKFREEEIKTIKEISSKVLDAIKTIFIEGKEKAMTKFN